ncbi:hypothetical protein SAMN04487970_10274 [Paenibacillus tianmuensis]|uniref:Toxin 44 n=1 Tax=Paenibacillus tianmuensis TaxID=624147 RepID=A0A1G4SE52_9BACL|nr:hypothetical protein [Paenibacillus tianmuensis]SCW67338.1 hypothetical protein SAMN04487970_10274 [Paenibacillus tianmuensis]
MKKITILFLVICLCLVFSVPVSATADSGKVVSIPNERVVKVLQDNNFDFTIVDGNIKLNQPTPAVVTKANNLLNSQFQQAPSYSAFTSYPTPWTHMKNHDRGGSQKFDAATKTAFGAAFLAWARNITLSWQEVVGIAVAGYGVYYFANSHVEDLYTFIKYYYREWGPGRFDHNGTFIGDYELLKEMRVTKNSDGTDGSFGTDARRSTILDPWF